MHMVKFVKQREMPRILRKFENDKKVATIFLMFVIFLVNRPT